MIIINKNWLKAYLKLKYPINNCTLTPTNRNYFMKILLKTWIYCNLSSKKNVKVRNAWALQFPTVNESSWYRRYIRSWQLLVIAGWLFWLLVCISWMLFCQDSANCSANPILLVLCCFTLCSFEKDVRALFLCFPMLAKWCFGLRSGSPCSCIYLNIILKTLLKINWGLGIFPLSL